MALARAGTHAIRLALESTFGTEPASYDSNKKSVQAWDIDVSSLKETEFENQAVKTDLMPHETGVGPSHPENAPSFSCYCEGLGTAAGDGVAASPTVLTWLMAICLGGTISNSTGSTVKTGSSPTTTSVAETDAANHAANTLVGFEIGGECCVRPVAGYSTDTMTLLMALPSAPSEGDEIYGGSGLHYSETAVQTAYLEAIGKGTYENFEAAGVVGNFSLPEVAATQPQTISFALRAATFTEDVSATQTAPTNARPISIAGGEFLLGAYGNTAASALKWARWSLELNNEWDADEACNEDDGIDGWSKMGADFRLTLHVRADTAPPTGISASTFRQSFLDGGSDNLYHVLLSFGQKTAGKICAFYLPKLRLITKPERVEVDGKAAQKLTFAGVQGMTEDAIWFRQF